MNILSLSAVGKAVGGEPLFEDVTIGFEQGEKVGLVGRNGSGKTTLLRMLAGEIEPDEGQIVRSRGLRFAALPQRPGVVTGMTVAGFLYADGHGADESEEQAAALLRYRAICDQLGLHDTTQQLQTLSGGMLKKAAVARCLALSSDVMILDEPTNHLDINTVTWLEQQLKTSASGFVLVTHDRYILDAVCDTILEIDQRRIYRYPGNYSTYLQRRAERQNQSDRAQQHRIATLRTELEWLQRGAKARTGKDKQRKQRIGALLDSGEEPEARMQPLPTAQRRLGKKALELNDVAKSYDSVPVISGFSYRFTPGERVGIIGPNGSGKSTFLDMIAGRTRPDRGTVEPGETTVFAYFDQTGARIDEELTALDYMKHHAERIRIDRDTTVSVEQFLERFLFPRSMFSLPLARLSGGEFRRLYLIRLLATAPNFLLLDEPTNDLDIDTLRVLEQYLEDFDGCVLMVSHDRALLNRLTDSLFIFGGDGSIRLFSGSYEDYRRAESSSAAAAAPRRKPPAATAARSAGRARSRGLTFREQREYQLLPDEIAVEEAEIEELETRFQQTTQDPVQLAQDTRRYHELRSAVEEKTARWIELAERAGE